MTNPHVQFGEVTLPVLAQLIGTRWKIEVKVYLLRAKEAVDPWRTEAHTFMLLSPNTESLEKET